MISRLTVLVMTTLLVPAVMAPAMELKDIVYTTRDAGTVVFSHTIHLQKKSRTTSNLSCKTCHSSTKEKNVHVTMAEMEQGKSCGACHNGSTAFALAACTRCHKVREITYTIKETGPVTFSHTQHLRTMQCTACHSGIFNAGPNPGFSMADMKKGKSCGACHNGKSAFALENCSKCHPVRVITYAVKGAGKVSFSHNSHVGIYGCAECHPRRYHTDGKNAVVSMAGMEEKKSCGGCHDGITAFTVKANCATCHKL